LGYVEQNLNPGERILYATHLHWLVLIRSILVDLIFSLAGLALIIWGFAGTHSQRGEAQAAEIAGTVLIAIGTFIFAIAAVRRNATEMAVTNKRVIIKVGVLRRRTVEMLNTKVEAIAVNQGLLGRIFGYGDIVVTGTGGTNEPFNGISAPLEFRRAVQAHSS